MYPQLVVDEKQEDPATAAMSGSPDSATRHALSGDFPELQDLPEIGALLGDASQADSQAPQLSEDIAAILQAASDARPLPRLEPSNSDDESIEVPLDMLDHAAEVLVRDLSRAAKKTTPVAASGREGAGSKTGTPKNVSTAPGPRSITQVGGNKVQTHAGATRRDDDDASIESGPATRGERFTVPIEAQSGSVGQTAYSDGQTPDEDVVAALGSIRVPPPPATEKLYLARRSGDPIQLLAETIRMRVSGAVHLHGASGCSRTIVLRDGDVVSAASDAAEESLIDFLILRGEVTRELVAAIPIDKLPRVGRRAAAALIARGFLGPDDLWPALRAHAEWLISRALGDGPASCRLDPQLPTGLRDEPNVFGGSAGIEVFVEAVRRTLRPDEALRRLGPPNRMVRAGPFLAMLSEAALPSEELGVFRAAPGQSLGDWLGSRSEERAAIAYAVSALCILQIDGQDLQAAADPEPTPAAPPPEGDHDVLGLDEHRQQANLIRQRVKARRALVEEGDYFSVLGVSPDATGYEIRRAFVAARRFFEPHRLLTATTADLADDVDLIVELIEEAYDVLRDAATRERYRDATRASLDRLASQR
jgi:hypothetical protein